MKMYKVIKLVAENIKKIKAIVIETAFDDVVKITGPNESGKTTVLDLIWWAIGGKEAVDDDPIRRGQKSAKIELDIGEYVITRTFTEKGSYLYVKPAEGVPPLSVTPQQFCDQLYSKYTFNPLNFIRAKKADRLEELLKIVDIKVDCNKLEEISGFEVKQNGNFIQQINTTYQRVYDQRALANKDLDQAKKVFESMEVIAKCEPAQAITDLVNKRDGILEHNKKNEEKKKRVADIAAKINALVLDKGRVDSEIVELRRQLETKITMSNGIQNNINALSIDMQAKEVENKQLEDLSTFEIDAEIEMADEQNKTYQKYLEREKAREKLELLQKKAVGFTERLDMIKNYKSELLSKANFPVKGLGFSSDGVVFDDLPFEQASMAKKLEISMAIAMAQNPKFRVVRIDDGSLLDPEHMEIIEKMAKENDFQVWIEVVDKTGQIGIYIEDGEIINK